jgi:hypothetical protein
MGIRSHLQSHFPIQQNLLADHVDLHPYLRSKLVLVTSHQASEDDALLQALSTYGLEKNMLPCAMGGGDTSTMIDWIADRRAIEMEEV